MRLTSDEFSYLKNELDVTPLMAKDELRLIELSHPQLYYTLIKKQDDTVSLITDTAFIFCLTNLNLNKFICEKFEEPLENLYMIHRLKYSTDGYAKRHRDRFTTYKTISVILSDDFEGGDMYINDIKIELNKKGDFVVFNGGKDFHEVTPITKGIRDVLIIWFSKRHLKFNSTLI